MWYRFRQNNSGGSFHFEPENGIGVNVWIEAYDAEVANVRALRLGLYFDGCADGIDCDCCGDRWDEAHADDGMEFPVIDEDWDYKWDNSVYLHPLEGKFLDAKWPDYQSALNRLKSKELRWH